MFKFMSNAKKPKFQKKNILNVGGFFLANNFIGMITPPAFSPETGKFHFMVHLNNNTKFAVIEGSSKVILDKYEQAVEEWSGEACPQVNVETLGDN